MIINQKNIMQYLWLTATILLIIWKGVLPGWKDKPADFNNYYVSAHLLVEGESIAKFYDSNWFSNQAKQIGIANGAKFSPFPPITAVIMTPFTIWTPLQAKRIWLFINLLILINLPFVIKKITAWSLLNTLLFLSIFTIPLASNLNFGQVYLFITFLLVIAIQLSYWKNKNIFVGISFGMVAAFKYIPLLFLGYLFNHQKRNTIFIWGGMTFFISFLIFYIFDPQAIPAFFEQFSSHVVGDLPGQGKYAVGFQSIDSLLNNLFIYDLAQNPTPFINLPILKPILKWLCLGIILSIIILLFKKNNYRLNKMFVSISIMGSFVFLPASASYHFLFLLLPILYIYMWLMTSQTKKVQISISILLIATFSLQAFMIPNIPAYPTINLFLHYPRLWGLFCLFLVLSYYYNKDLSKRHG